MGKRSLSSRIPITAFSLEHIRPHPKAGARPPAGNGKRRFTAILTDSPEKKVFK